MPKATQPPKTVSNFLRSFLSSNAEGVGLWTTAMFSARPGPMLVLAWRLDSSTAIVIKLVESIIARSSRSRICGSSSASRVAFDCTVLSCASSTLTRVISRLMSMRSAAKPVAELVPPTEPVPRLASEG